jgi:hypothetical protein
LSTDIRKLALEGSPALEKENCGKKRKTTHLTENLKALMTKH